MIDTTLASANSSCLRKNLLKRIEKPMKTIDDKIIDEKLQYDINRGAVKMSALLSGKIDKHELLTGKQIFTPDQSRVLEQSKFIYYPLGKALEKQIKTTEDQGIKQVEV